MFVETMRRAYLLHRTVLTAHYKCCSISNVDYVDPSVELRHRVVLVQYFALVQYSADRSIIFEACYNRCTCEGE